MTHMAAEIFKDSALAGGEFYCRMVILFLGFSCSCAIVCSPAEYRCKCAVSRVEFQIPKKMFFLLRNWCFIGCGGGVAPCCQGLYPYNKFVNGKRFLQVVVASKFKPFYHIFCGASGGKEEYRCGYPLGAEFLCKGEAVHNGHHHICYNNINMKTRGKRKEK